MTFFKKCVCSVACLCMCVTVCLLNVICSLHNMLHSGHPTGCGMSGTMSTLTDVFPPLIQMHTHSFKHTNSHKHSHGLHLASTRSLTNSKHKVIVRLVVDRIQYIKHLVGEISHCAQVLRNWLLYLFREKTERQYSYTTTSALVIK